MCEEYLLEKSIDNESAAPRLFFTFTKTRTKKRRERKKREKEERKRNQDINT